MSKVTEEKEWRAENDLYTLMEAEKIKSDKTRFNAATKKANKLAKEKEAEAKVAKKIAKPKKSSKPKKSVRKLKTKK